MLQCMKNGTYPEEPIPGPSTDNPNDDQSTSNETSNLYASSVNMPKVSKLRKNNKLLSKKQNDLIFRSLCLH